MSAQLNNLIQLIKNATKPGENTAVRVGSTLELLNSEKAAVDNVYNKSETLDLINQVKLMISSNAEFLGTISPSTTIPAEGDIWAFAGPGSYPGGIVVDPGEMAIISRTKGVWSSAEIILPQASQNIPDFEALSFPVSGDIQSIYGESFWKLKDGQTATISDIPSTDALSKWELIGENKKDVDTDTIFNNTIQETPEIQVTASGTVGNTSVSTIHGLSISMGALAKSTQKLTLAFAQNPATPVTQIEVRLFQGKTVGGTLITKKRQTVSPGAVTQAVVDIIFDTMISYTGEMWVQIMMNNPFAYKRVSPAVLRTAALGYGTPMITTVNNLDGTSFTTSQAYSDVFLSFNTLEDITGTTSTGKDVILSAFSANVNSDVTGNYAGANSYLNPAGQAIPSANWRTSEAIPVKAGNVYKYKGATNQSTAGVGMVGYDSAGAATVLVGNSDHYNTPINVTIPTGIVTVKICGYYLTPPTLTFYHAEIDPTLIPYINQPLKISKTWNCVGHSIWAQDGIVFSGTSTLAVGIQTLAKRIFLFGGYNKYAYSGRSLGAIVAHDGSGNPLPNNPNDTDSITYYFNTWVDTTPSFWTLDTITNDFKRDILIGTIADYNNNTGNSTYYGALRLFNDKVQALTPGAPVICFNALRRNNGGYTSTSVSPVTGKSLLDYEKAIMTVAALNGWLFVDQFRQSEITDETLSITTLDGLHPNNFGYLLAAKPVIRALWLYFKNYIK